MKRYLVLWPTIAPGAFFQSGKATQVGSFYKGDEFDDLGTAEELDRMIREGMIEEIPSGATVG